MRVVPRLSMGATRSLEAKNFRLSWYDLEVPVLVGVLISHIAERALAVVFMAAVVLAMFVYVIAYDIIRN